ncbi:hypothetical protein [Sphingobium naphthae]|uniref:Uncharacterized protein n=1 Tax=Sphingobium naphthae TaxID=1886786 RepID=A0ABU3ZRZ1_9SPHN|nr:hypothetical protein [Sphingobium naphthae]MDV5822291.1 hypothetical protein [Sphingobium naphthae]
MKHVAYTIPGVVDENGDPVVFGGMVMPGHGVPLQTVAPNGQKMDTPSTAEIIHEREFKLPSYLPEVDR